MRRAPLVLGATAAGLAGVLAFHTPPATTALGGLEPSAPRHGAATSAAPPPTTSPPTGDSATTVPPTTAAPTTAASRTATGAAVDYHYGVIAVSATVSGGRITAVRIASLDDGGNPRSQAIDDQSVPILEQQAITAQSANIDGVSGATYTSEGFAQSLQSALSKLGR